MTVVQVNSALTEITQLSAFAKEHAEKVGFSAMEIMQIELAVTEATANCIEHAYNGEKDGIIEMEVCFNSDTLTIDLKDKGNPLTSNIFEDINEDFDDPTANILDIPESGRGLKIILSFMDEAMTTRSDGWNHTIMKKKLGDTPVI